MFRKLLSVIGNSFGKAVDAQEKPDEIDLSFFCGEMRASFMPEIEGEDGPLLHALSWKSTGLVKFDDDNDTIDVPENTMTRIIALDGFTNAQEVQDLLQTWQVEENNIVRIGVVGKDEETRHMVTFVPKGWHQDTMLKRMELDPNSQEETWAIFRNHVQSYLDQEELAPTPIIDK